MRRLYFSLPIVFFFILSSTSAQTYNVKDYGAVNDGTTLNTTAIQTAINECTRNGGGTVLLSGGGKYMTGTLYLKDNVTLHIGNGTVLLGSPNYKDYTTDTHKNMYKNEGCNLYCH